MTIREKATAAADKLREENPRASARTIDADDLEEAARTHLKYARKLRKSEPDTVVRTILHGGIVPGSYRYPADADKAIITGIDAKSLEFFVERRAAIQRPGGYGSLLIVRAIKPGQINGRILFSD